MALKLLRRTELAVSVDALLMSALLRRPRRD
jgi:hypothetical protein